MSKSFVGCLQVVEREANRLFIPVDLKRFAADLDPNVAGTTRPSTGIRIDLWHLWGHNVTITLHLDPIGFPDKEPLIYSCRAEVSWSSTSRSVSMALAAIKLYERAVEFAALCECILSDVTFNPEVKP